MAWSTGKTALTGGVVGLILLIVGVIVGWVVVPSVIRNQIADTLVLNEGSEAWDRWIDLPVPVRYRIYIFHIKNMEGITKGEKPQVEERGPYVYREKRTREEVVLDTESSTVKYKTRFTFTFDQEASGDLKETDEITIINSLAVGFALIAENIREMSDTLKMFNTAVEKIWPDLKNPFFYTTTVGDFLFGKLPMYCNQTVELVNMDTLLLCEAFKLIAPKSVKLDDGVPYFNTFSALGYKNDTDDGVYEMDSGHDEISKLGNIKTWEGSSMVNKWKADSCNQIRGSDSSIFRPYLEMDDVKTLPVFNTDICRSIDLTYEGDVEYKGINGRRYIGDKSVFANVMENNDNYCYCPNSVRGVTYHGGCLKSGLLDCGTCQNSPLTLSFPHFIMADPSIAEGIDGLNPDEEKHKIFLDLEPYTGYPLRAASRTQINIYLKRMKDVTLMQNFPDVLLPIFWLEETVELTDDLIDDLNDQLFNKLKIADGVKWATIAIGIVLAAGSAVFYFLKSSKKST